MQLTRSTVLFYNLHSLFRRVDCMYTARLYTWIGIKFRKAKIWLNFQTFPHFVHSLTSIAQISTISVFATTTVEGMMWKMICLGDFSIILVRSAVTAQCRTTFASWQSQWAVETERNLRLLREKNCNIHSCVGLETCISIHPPICSMRKSVQ